MQQTWYTNGTLWGASDTAVQVGGELKAGIAWFAVDPKINGAGKVEGNIKKQGYVALADNNLTMPGHRDDAQAARAPSPSRSWARTTTRAPAT